MASKVLVVGSGVIGLRTALELLRKNVRVCLISPKTPTNVSTTSMGAGGLWMPFHCDDTRVDGWALSTLDELTTQHASSDRNVEVVPKVSFKRQLMEPPTWSKSSFLQFQQLDVDSLYKYASQNNMRLPRREQLKCRVHACVAVSSSNLFQDNERNRDRGQALGCDGVVNCTGLGSRALCLDEALVGARGVLLHYDRYNPSLGDNCVGGTYLVGDEEECVRESEREMLLRNAQTLGIDTANNDPVGEWVGFRPYRSSVRLEIDNDLTQSGMRVVHNYGFGGSGWTVMLAQLKKQLLS
ncbi:D-aspartate oxidase [Skeletonema marinoi]|uniref:D-aspartate oxidase n=1 Tax=Skeletonema marinoi TaxID=267567 RepID=A0AAD9DGH6_9STRA|nr:D-aspartate oxidase [Skeletonema marinoi]